MPDECARALLDLCWCLGTALPNVCFKRDRCAMAYDIFLSYRRVDQPLARSLVETLESRGVRVWWDQKIEGGEDWRDAIVENLTESAALVILFSDACNSSKQLKKELAIADTLDKTVVPVLIEDTKPKGHFLYEMAAINWLQIHPNPETKIVGLAGRLIEELDLTPAAASAPAFKAEPIGEPGLKAATPRSPATPEHPIEADTVRKVVEQTEQARKSPKGLRDYLPFKWYEILIALGIGGLAAAFAEDDPVAGYTANPYWDGPLFFLVMLLFIALLVFPFRYYFRRRRVGRAMRYYFFSTMTISVVLGFFAGLHPDFIDDSMGGAENLAAMMIGMIVVVAAMSLLAFGIYGLLHFQRTVRSFNKNVEAI